MSSETRQKIGKTNKQNISDRPLRFSERFLLWFVPLVVVLIVRAIGLTARKRRFGLEHLEDLKKKGLSWIYSIWHTNVLFSPYLLRNQNVAVLVSASRDGEWIARAVERLGNTTIRGSTSRGGVGALKSLVRHLKKGSPAAITPDGPRGPAFEVQPGIVTSAQITGSPIIPFHYECTRQWVAERSWDRHRIPKPFTTFVISYGEPIYIPQELDADEFERERLRVEEALLANMRFCEEKARELRSRRSKSADGRTFSL